MADSLGGLGLGEGRGGGITVAAPVGGGLAGMQSEHVRKDPARPLFGHRGVLVRQHSGVQRFVQMRQPAHVNVVKRPGGEACAVVNPHGLLNQKTVERRASIVASAVPSDFEIRLPPPGPNVSHNAGTRYPSGVTTDFPAYFESRTGLADMAFPRLIDRLLIVAATIGLASCAKPTDPAAGTSDDEPPAAAFHNPLTPEQIADGWISLFDGETLFGWESNDETVNWRVENGTITSDTGGQGLLHTTVPFADYEIKIDFRFEPGGNSGLFLRTRHIPENAETDCYELNLADTHPDGYTTGSYVNLKKTDEPIIASGEWHTFHVTLDGDHSIVRIDDDVVLDFLDEQPDGPNIGFIGLQHNQGKIEFRNIFLKPLGMVDLFNGVDLTGWRVVPGSKSQYAVDNGMIHVTGGAGFLETEGVYGDFVLQLDAILNGKDLNSGVFFRALAGTEEAPSNGYEMQIHNVVADGDPTRPVNGGTGCIFRRTEARRVVSRDNQWFTATLVAAGPRIAVWIDGYQVTDWEDTRLPDENPRKGKRTEPGHISLQGHDPATNLSFRNLRIAELTAQP